MYGVRVYITPEDIIQRLSAEDREKFSQCVFTNVTRPADGTITIDCVLFNNNELFEMPQRRQRYPRGNETLDLSD